MYYRSGNVKGLTYDVETKRCCKKILFYEFFMRLNERALSVDFLMRFKEQHCQLTLFIDTLLLDSYEQSLFTETVLRNWYVKALTIDLVDSRKQISNCVQKELTSRWQHCNRQQVLKKPLICRLAVREIYLYRQNLVPMLQPTEECF